MERLTRRSDTGHAYYPRCFEEPCNGNGCKFKDCPFDETICERIAAYEDSECEPEEVLPKDKADEIALKLMRLADLESLCNYTRLRDLAEADKDGRLVMLPCKVGDFVYGFHNGKSILPMVAKWFETNYDGWSVAVQHVPMAPRFYRFSDFGKTAFLTREKAEKALEAMKDG